jgi:hypothetical protein
MLHAVQNVNRVDAERVESRIANNARWNLSPNMEFSSGGGIAAIVDHPQYSRDQRGGVSH